MSKPFNTIIKRVINYLKRNNHLSVKQYCFLSSTSTTVALTINTNRISETLDYKHLLSSAIALEFLKNFDKVWRRMLLYKQAIYGISGRVFSDIRCFLSGRFMNDYYSEVHEIDVGLPEASLFDPIHFYCVILTICLKAITIPYIRRWHHGVCMHHQYVDDRCGAVYRSSDLILTAESGKDWLVPFSTSPPAKKTRYISFSLRRPPIQMCCQAFNEAP